MADEVTSESLDSNATLAAMTAAQMSSSSRPNMVIGRAILLAVLAVLNMGGNGFTLITIRLTPRLWTKTNYILASMLVSDTTTSVLMSWNVTSPHLCSYSGTRLSCSLSMFSTIRATTTLLPRLPSRFTDCARWSAFTTSFSCA